MRRLALAATVALALAGCGSSNKSSSESAATATPAQTQAAATPAATPTTSATAAISKDLSKKPTIPAPAGTPPSDLVIKDIVKGKGKKAKAGKSVTVQYVGSSWSTGQEFDASWDRGQP